MLGKNLIQAAAGAAGAGGGGLGVEDVFSTWLYTGTGVARTITNGIDLAGEGGMVWLKDRVNAIASHVLQDSERNSFDATLNTDNTSAQNTTANRIDVSSSGFTLTGPNVNTSGDTFTSWTFRKAEKFFDVVTYTGNGVDPRDISHNLGSVPGSIIVKRTDVSGDNWIVYHRSVTNGYLILNSTSATSTRTDFIYQNPTSTTFRVGNNSVVNASGGTYVAYLFAHDAGGFGDSGNESVIKCGSFTTDGSGNATVDLGWEPQWLLTKRNEAGEPWMIADNLRGFPVSGTFPRLEPNSSSAELNTPSLFGPTATGFQTRGNASSNRTYIYIAIRRGPMKTPTDATEVFEPVAYTGDAVDNRVITTGFPVDYLFATSRALLNNDGNVFDRMRGAKQRLVTQSTTAESTMSANYYVDGLDSNTGFILGGLGGLNNNGTTFISHAFRRAPGFFDVVAYTGTGVARTVPHNLGVAPELMIVKRRNLGESWAVYSAALPATHRLRLNFDGVAVAIPAYWNSTAATASVFSVGTDNATNASASTYIAYLFATCPGVSKVGNYTGAGTTLSVDCGFTAGARFVMIKRTDSTGDWYVWDTARGIVSGNDPYLRLNSTAGEVTNTDYIDPLSTGFQISSSAPAAINASGGSYIFLAIA